jgi:hypothetical protein
MLLAKNEELKLEYESVIKEIKDLEQQIESY